MIVDGIIQKIRQRYLKNRFMHNFVDGQSLTKFPQPIHPSPIANKLRLPDHLLETFQK